MSQSNDFITDKIHLGQGATAQKSAPAPNVSVPSSYEGRDFLRTRSVTLLEALLRREEEAKQKSGK